MSSSDATVPASPAPSQRVGGLVEIPALLRELGANPVQVLAETGLGANALEHIDQRVPSDLIDRLLHACLTHTRCPHFGLLAGQRWSLAHHGALGELMRTAPTVGDALRSFTVMQHLNSEMGAAFVLEEDDAAALGYALYRTDLEHPDQIYDVAMGVAANILRGLCRLQWTAREVLLSRPVPEALAPYKQFFGPRVRFM